MAYLCIDIGGTYTKFGLIDHSGRIIERWREKTPSSLDDLKKLLLFEIKRHETAIKGIGLSCPGRVDNKKGYIHTGGALEFLYDFQIKEWFNAHISLPFSIINDGKAAALSEWWIGNLKGVENGAAIVLGTGVGGGLILNNQLYSGSHFQAGELSFMIQNDKEQSPTQLMGYFGSAVLFIQEATSILDVPQDDYSSVFTALKSNPPEKLQTLFENYCASIARLILNIHAILDLEKVVIGGAISEQDSLIEMIRKQYQELIANEPHLNIAVTPLSIDVCQFNNSANLLGSLYQVLLDLEN